MCIISLPPVLTALLWGFSLLESFANSEQNHSANALYHLVYMSRATQLLSRDDLATLLEQARLRNKEAGVTGMLLYKDLSFIQLLEGTHSAIGQIFASIKGDERHTRVRILLHETLDARIFKEWYMGFHNFDESDDQDIDGFSPYLRDQSSLEKLIEHPSRALNLLQHFRVRS